jgi:hypothetical protein
MEKTEETAPDRGVMTLREFCERQGWGYPLPEPGTPAASEWLAASEWRWISSFEKD